MIDARTIIAQRGGIRPLARKLSHLNHTTVQGWWDRNRIPEAHIAAVEAAPTDMEQAA